MKISQIIWIGAVLICAAMPSLCYGKSVTFLPRDEEMVSYPRDYRGEKYILTEKECESDRAQNSFNRCMACVQARTECPDCCLKKATGAGPSLKSLAMRCTPEDDAKYTPRNVVFVPNDDCSRVAACVTKWNDYPPRNPLDVVNTTQVVRDQYCLNHTQHELPPYDDNLPHCQVLGCSGIDNNGQINAKPKEKKPDDACEMDGSEMKWICNTNDLDTPDYKGCLPWTHEYYTKGTKACPSSLLDNHGTPDRGTINWQNSGALGGGTLPLPGAGGSHSFPGGSTTYGPSLPPTCYTYEFTNDPSDPNKNYLQILANCRAAAMGYEQFVKDDGCCKLGSEVCCGKKNGSGQCLEGVKINTITNQPSAPGCEQNCVSTVCQERVAWPECNAAGGAANELCCDNPALNGEKCLQYSAQAQLCLDAKKGKCLNCFQVFGTDTKPFEYDFIAKSNQKMIIIWQLHVSPKYEMAQVVGGVKMPIPPPIGGPNTGPLPLSYLYTMVKIFDITNGGEGEEVYPGASGKGAMSQRAFSGAFSIFSASVVEDGFLTQGHRYRVQLFWYIPKLDNYILSAEVQRGEFTIIKIRE